MARSNDRDSDAVALARYRESPRFQLRFAVVRAAYAIAFIYLVSVAFNALDLAVASGFVDFRAATILELATLSGPTSARVLPTIIGAGAGIAGLAILFAIAPVRFGWGKRSYRKSLMRYRESRLLKRKREEDPELEINRKVHIEQWADELLASSEVERQERFESIQRWFDQDRLLLERTAVEIARRRLMQSVLLAVIGPVITVVVVRVALLLG